MIRFLSTCFILLLGLPCFGQLLPGLADTIESRFAKATTVCVCVAEHVSPSYASDPNAVRRVAVLKSLRIYKGPDSPDLSKVSLEMPFGLSPTSLYLLFITSGSDSPYTLTDALELPASFLLDTAYPRAHSFENDIAVALDVQGGNELPYLHLVERFDALSAETLNALQHVATSDKTNVALLAMSVLLKRQVTPSVYFPRFVEKLAETPEGIWPDFGDLAEVFSENANAADISRLEVLATSKNLEIRYDALGALHKRADPRTNVFFGKQLDSEDELTEYLAVVSLAEINHITGEFAPGIGMFERSRGKYIAFWKDWLRAHNP